jgi:hypothetical protein
VQLIGVLIILFSFGFWLRWVCTGQKRAKAVGYVCAAGILAGIAVIVSNRITEFTTPVGSIKAAATEALSNANEVALIRNRVENQSATVDMVATSASNAKRLSEALSNQVAIQTLRVDTLTGSITTLGKTTSALQLRESTLFTNITTAQLQIDALSNSLRLTAETASKLANDQDFLALAQRAESYNALAFDQLSQIAHSTNSFSPYALLTVQNITERLSMDHASDEWTVSREQNGARFYSGPYTSDEVATTLANSSFPKAAADAARLQDIKLLVPKMVDIATNSTDLLTRNRAMRMIEHYAGREFLPWKLDDLRNWWSANQDSYTNWPYEEYAQAMVAFTGTRYQDALHHFQKVIETDKDADKSRALAIASAAALNDTLTATNLLNSFHDSNNRWAKWANARIALSTGSVLQATATLVDLATNNETFAMEEAFIHRGNDIWRQIDWDTFDHLSHPTNCFAHSERQPHRPTPLNIVGLDGTPSAEVPHLRRVGTVYNLAQGGVRFRARGGDSPRHRMSGCGKKAVEISERRHNPQGSQKISSIRWCSLSPRTDLRTGFSSLLPEQQTSHRKGHA